MEKLRGHVGSCQTRDSAFNLRSEDSSAEDQQIPVYVRISLVRAQNFWDFELSTIGDFPTFGESKFWISLFVFNALASGDQIASVVDAAKWLALCKRSQQNDF